MTDETWREKHRMEQQADLRAHQNSYRLEGLKCPFCGSGELREKMFILVCNECDKCFDPVDARSDEPHDSVSYQKENPR